VARVLPAEFTYLEELFDTYTEMIRPLPHQVFSSFITTSTLPIDEQTALLTNLLLPFLAVEPKSIKIFKITQQDLIQDFLPHSANVANCSENYKMALLVQTLLLRMRERGVLNARDGKLRKAVEKGIEARKKKARLDRRTKGKGNNPVEIRAKELLTLNPEYLGLILDMLEMDAGMEWPGRSDSASQSSQLSDLGPDPEPSLQESEEDEDENMEDSGSSTEDDGSRTKDEDDTIVVRHRRGKV
jgi:hypothetical protein